MAAIAQAPPARPGARRRGRPRRHVAGGILWISVVAVLLAGIVAVNVALLRVNLRLDQIGRERDKLHADNATLSSQVSSASASARIQDLGVRDGLVPASTADTTYYDMAPRRR
jgi:cell division protein FtsL